MIPPFNRLRRAFPFALATQYLLGNSLRSGYLSFAIFLAFTSYVLLVALGSFFGPTQAPKGGFGGIIGINAVYGSLPASYAKEIARIPGVKSVIYGDFMPVVCRSNVVAQINGKAAIGGSAIDHIAPLLDPSDLRKWHKDRHAIVAGYALAKRCHWHKGMLLTLQGGMGIQPTLKVRVIAIYHTGAKFPALNQIAIVHYDYLDGLNPPSGQGRVLFMNADAADPSQAERLAVAIDAHFANRSPPTASTVYTASQGALTQFGNVLKIVEFVMAAVFACALLVTVNVAAHAAAERRSQFILLRVLGFSRPWLMTLAITELLCVAVLGCGLGLALGLALVRWVVKPALGSVFLGLFTVPESALALAPALAAGFVLVSALIPVWEILRLRTAKFTAP